MKYKLKSNNKFIIKVIQLTKKSFPDVMEFIGKNNIRSYCNEFEDPNDDCYDCYIEIRSSSVHMFVKENDYIAKEVGGVYNDIFNFIKPNILAENYEKVEEIYDTVNNTTGS